MKKGRRTRKEKGDQRLKELGTWTRSGDESDSEEVSPRGWALDRKETSREKLFQGAHKEMRGMYFSAVVKPQTETNSRKHWSS